MKYEIRNNLIIRKVRKAEVARCVNMARVKELEIDSEDYATQAEFEAGRKAGFFYVAESGNKIVGFLLGFELSGQVGYLDLICVKEKFRGQGIGKLLLKHFQQELRSKRIKYIFLLSPLNSKRSSKFYSDNGFSAGHKFRLFWKKLKNQKKK